jgi:replicative DNA helicase
MGMRSKTAPEAERSVLGGIFLDNRALGQVTPILKPADFEGLQLRRIFESMLELEREGFPVDPVTMASSLSHKAELRALGGVDYLLWVAGSTASTVNIEHHAKLIAIASRERQIAEVLSGAADAYLNGEDPRELIARLNAEIEALELEGRPAPFKDAPTLFTEAIDAIQRAYLADGHITGLPTGLEDLDSITAGFQPADLIILGARPSMGKTALALQVLRGALDATEGALSAALFSLEMPAIQLAIRMLGSVAEVPSQGVRTGVLGSDEILRLVACSKGLGRLNMHIDDTAAISITELRSKAKALHLDPKSPPLGLIIVDYLQLMRGPGRSREQEISEISRGLKALAKELNIPVIALSQLNRKLESRTDKRPIMSDLRESGAIEQDADVILFLYRDEVYNEDTEDRGVVEVLIRKHRNGPLGTVRLQFKKEIGVFR